MTVFRLFCWLLLELSSLSVLANMPVSSAANPSMDHTHHTQPTVTMDLRTCFERLRSVNHEVLIERESIRQALANVHQERTRLLPKAEVQYAWNYRQEVSDVSSRTDTNVQFERRGPYSRSNAKVLGVVPIIDINEWLDLKSMRLRHEIAGQTAEYETQLILNAAAILFFEHWRAEAEKQIILDNIARVQELEKLAKSQLESGVASRMDLLRVQVKLSDEQEALIQQRLVSDEILLRLKRLLNWPLGKPLVLEPYTYPQHHLAEDLPWVLAYSYEHRIELLRAETEILKNQAVKDAQVARHYPTLTLYGDYGYSGEDFTPDTDIPEYRALLIVSFPLFDGLESKARADHAASRIREAQHESERIRQEIERQIRTSREQLQALDERYALILNKVALAQEEYLLAKERFRGGMADNQESIDALNQLTRVELDRITAQYLQQRANLEYARSRGDMNLLFKQIQPLLTNRTEKNTGLQPWLLKKVQDQNQQLSPNKQELVGFIK